MKYIVILSKTVVHTAEVVVIADDEDDMHDKLFDPDGELLPGVRVEWELVESTIEVDEWSEEEI